LRICLVSHLTDQIDEGVRSVAANLAGALRAWHTVEFMPLQHPSTWNRIRRFRPDIIHFVLSPTSIGLVVSKALSLACRQARTIVSAPHPEVGVFRRWVLPFRPHLILAQALESECRFRECGYHTLFLPNGVDTERFVPVNDQTKRGLREKYGVGNQFVILHVGPLKQGRNVQMLGQLQRGGRQVLVVGRPSDPGEKEIAVDLERRGCMIWSGYFAGMQEIYALSDCYVFPTMEHGHCIETPLSVLEAMACNLPVVSTPFGALPRIVDVGDGMVYAQSADEFELAVARFESNGVGTSTRHKVLCLSWTDVARRLEGIYAQLSQQAQVD
jgi:glycosyltransferase involved in cell wall biosynthesis